MNGALELMRRYGDADLDKIARYMEKSKLKLNEVGILLDTRDCMRKLYNRPLTSEELWPKHLHEAHDRVTQMWADECDRKRKEELLYGFQRVPDLHNLIKGHYGMLYKRGYRKKHAALFEKSFRDSHFISHQTYHRWRHKALAFVEEVAIQNGLHYVTRSYKRTAGG